MSNDRNIIYINYIYYFMIILNIKIHFILKLHNYLEDNI